MKFSKKLESKLAFLRFVGYFTVKEAEEKGMRLVTGRDGMLCLYWLVDEADGIICDTKFQCFGPPALIAAGEVASEVCLRKNYDQASRISADLLDTLEFPKEAHPFLNQAISAIDMAVHQCIDIPYARVDYTTPIEWDITDNPNGLPGWEEFPLEQKRKLIETVIEKEIRPYIELDAGGVKIEDLKENGEVHIKYEGSCTTCHSATGSTLSAIQGIIKARLHPSLTVIPILG